MKTLFAILIILAALIGEVMCVVKFVKCDFEPSYKAEIIYGGAAVTGFGAIVGYLDLGK